MHHGVYKLETKAKHGSVLGVQYFREPLGELSCPHSKMRRHPGVGGQLLPSCRPHMVGARYSTFGVKGSWPVAPVWGVSLGWGGGTSKQGGDTLLHLLTQRGRKVWV